MNEREREWKGGQLFKKSDYANQYPKMHEVKWVYTRKDGKHDHTKYEEKNMNIYNNFFLLCGTLSVQSGVR